VYEHLVQSSRAVAAIAHEKLLLRRLIISWSGSNEIASSDKRSCPWVYVSLDSLILGWCLASAERAAFCAFSIFA
jgi:hypothetical protein